MILPLLLLWSTFTLTSTTAFAPLQPSRKKMKTLCLSLDQEQGQQKAIKDAYPVLSRIAGINWTGECRYVNADLVYASQLKLVGGVRYDINDEQDETFITLSSFLTFPNGNTREVVMQGTKSATSPTIRLNSTANDGGPIYMLLTELAPDTILINEIEEASGKTILTSSLSVTNEGLVQISHEVGDGGENAIEGHQVWRLTGDMRQRDGPIQYDDFELRPTTGR